jgi:hypothetical protein
VIDRVVISAAYLLRPGQSAACVGFVGLADLSTHGRLTTVPLRAHPSTEVVVFVVQQVNTKKKHSNLTAARRLSAS